MSNPHPLKAFGLGGNVLDVGDGYVSGECCGCFDGEAIANVDTGMVV